MKTLHINQDLLVNQQLLSKVIDNYTELIDDPEFRQDVLRRRKLLEEKARLVNALGAATLLQTNIAMHCTMESVKGHLPLSKVVGNLELPPAQAEELIEDITLEVNIQEAEGKLNIIDRKGNSPHLLTEDEKAERAYTNLKNLVARHLIEGNRGRAIQLCEKFLNARPMYLKKLLDITHDNIYQSAKATVAKQWDGMKFESKVISNLAFTDYIAANIIPVYERKKYAIYHRLINKIKEEEHIHETPTNRSMSFIYTSSVNQSIVWPVTMSFGMDNRSALEGYDYTKDSIKRALFNTLDRTLKDFAVNDLQDGNVRKHFQNEFRQMMKNTGITMHSINIQDVSEEDE